jgi:hypothetical protein
VFELIVVVVVVVVGGGGFIIARFSAALCSLTALVIRPWSAHQTRNRKLNKKFWKNI